MVIHNLKNPAVLTVRFLESMNNLWIVGVTGSFFEKFVFYPFISLKSIWVQTGSRPLFNASNKYLKPTNNFF